MHRDSLRSPAARFAWGGPAAEPLYYDVYRKKIGFVKRVLEDRGWNTTNLAVEEIGRLSPVPFTPSGTELVAVRGANYVRTLGTILDGARYA